jgi:AcrR family transcriptional regulator
MSQDIDSTRKNPKQARSKHTVDTIIDATARILGKEGSTRLTTNYLASKSGFSIGTIYQYFPNRESILLALIARQRAAVQRRVEAIVLADGSLEDKVRLIVHTLHDAFQVHRNPARRLVAALLRLTGTSGLPAPPDDFARALVRVWREERGEQDRQLNESEAFVLSRAVIEVLRHATLYGSPLLGTRELEDALVRMVLGFLRAT